MKKSTPTSENIVAFITSQGGYVLRREIARAFYMKGAAERRQLKDVLTQLERGGQIERVGKAYRVRLTQELRVVEIGRVEPDGMVYAFPVVNREVQTHESVLFKTLGSYSVQPGQRYMVRIETQIGPHYEVTILKKLQANVRTVMGVLEQGRRNEWFLVPPERKNRLTYRVVESDVEDLEEGDLVEAEVLSGPSSGTPRVRLSSVTARQEDLLNKPSLYAIQSYDLPHIFPEAVVQHASKLKLPRIQGREDLRAIPLVTVDDQDARDHDDAVWAQPAEDLPGGWEIIVAIADVSHFVKPHDVLDREALARANSVYFPDQVVPMLPERLSNDLCSLRPHVDRPCLAVRMFIDETGKLKSKTFFRAMMRSHGKLTYQEVQKVWDGRPSQMDPELQKNLLPNLKGAYAVLKQAREKRGTLDFDKVEMKVQLGEDGQVKAILPRPRYDSHQMIEEFMILANVAAAQFVGQHKLPLMYRVHDEPPSDKVEDLRQYLRQTPWSLPKGQVLKPIAFRQILKAVADTPMAPAINELVLRSQAQAVYSPENLGHFGLNLPQYCHFTSPIRRYADILVHRAILWALKWPKDEYDYDHQTLLGIGEEISEKERRAAKAERDTIDRYIALYFRDRVGDTLSGRITGMTDFALFINLDETGTDGMLPLRNLGGDYFHFDPKTFRITGRRTGLQLGLGDPIEVRIESVDPVTGSLLLSAATSSSKPSARRPLKGRKRK